MRRLKVWLHLEWIRETDPDMYRELTRRPEQHIRDADEIMRRRRDRDA